MRPDKRARPLYRSLPPYSHEVFVPFLLMHQDSMLPFLLLICNNNNGWHGQASFHAGTLHRLWMLLELKSGTFHHYETENTNSIFLWLLLTQHYSAQRYSLQLYVLCVLTCLTLQPAALGTVRPKVTFQNFNMYSRGPTRWNRLATHVSE